eukprot:jgi/Tetstr1/429221/TSEL_000177.t1
MPARDSSEASDVRCQGFTAVGARSSLLLSVELTRRRWLRLFLQQQVDDLSGKLADSEAAATARVADLANELKQARELKAASERLAHEVTDAGDATMSESHQGKVHGGVLESKQMASNQLEKKRKFQQDCLGWMHKMMRKHDENCPPAL